MKTSILDAEVGGAYFGIAGALVLALAVPASKWGWLLFLGSNVCWLTFAYRQRFRKLYWQTVVYTGSSLLASPTLSGQAMPFRHSSLACSADQQVLVAWSGRDTHR